MFTSVKEIIIGLFVFCVILFFYLHIQFHLKTSDDLEIYEVEQVSKEKIEEICDLRQPVLIDICEDEYKIIMKICQYCGISIREVEVVQFGIAQEQHEQPSFSMQQ